jgi:putative nucleotidyltransferase with HDIG domain
LDAIIEVIALAIEKKDPATAGHQHQVANLARSIAEEMELSEDMVDAIRVAGFIHDLGKIGIPTEILSKPGILNDAEKTIIRGHAQIGFEILQKIEFPWPIAEIVYQHHERMDGLGYPRGLKGDAIMLEARILACADVIEELASHRPYRPALGIEAALDEIARGRGVKFDADVVDACLRLFREKGYTLQMDGPGRGALE